LEPLFHPDLNLILINQFFLVCFPPAALDAFPNVDGVLNVLASSGSVSSILRISSFAVAIVTACL
jgi:hypothetical protein